MQVVTNCKPMNLHYLCKWLNAQTQPHATILVGNHPVPECAGWGTTAYMQVRAELTLFKLYLS